MALLSPLNVGLLGCCALAWAGVGTALGWTGLAAGLIWPVLLLVCASLFAELGVGGRMLCGDGEAFSAYNIIKGGFTMSTSVYYGITCMGLRNSVPPVGQPTLLYFNHSNGLTDAKMVLRTCPRMVRFIAKDTLWKMPVVNILVKAAAAVPLRRRQDHEGAEGSGAPDNSAMFAAVTKALNDGQCLGIAPEGTSKMRTMIDGFKKGIGIMAVEAVFTHLGDEPSSQKPFAVNVLPCGLVYMHRERWRSEVLVTYGTPVKVDSEFLRAHGVTEDMTDARAPARQQCVNALVEQLEAALESITLTVPPPAEPDAVQQLEGDFVALGVGVTAARIHCETEVSLQEWVPILQHFARALRSNGNEELAEKVKGYQKALDFLGIPDALVLQYMKAGYRLPPPGTSIYRIAFHAAQCFALLALSLPGLLLWAPLMALCSVRTRLVIRQGKHVDGGNVLRRRRNFDTVADGNMLLGFVVLSAMCTASSAAVAHWKGLVGAGLLAGCVVLPAVLWLSARLLEECAASARSFRAEYALLVASARGVEALADTRRIIKKALALLPGSPNAPVADMDVTSGLPSWDVVGITHRHRADWHDAFFGEDLTFFGAHEN